MNQGIQVEVANTSYLLDTAVPNNEKLYGYHRLEDPLVVITNEHGHLIPKKQSQVQQYKEEPKPVLVDRNDSHLKKNKAGDPKVW